MAESRSEQNWNLKHQCLKLPTGKKYYFYIIAAEDDREKIEEIVTCLKESFHLKCIYDAVDCFPGVDKFDFMKVGMSQSVKVVLFLSQQYTNDDWCTYQQKIALSASLDEKIPCIVPVILEDVEEEDVSLLSFLTFVDARSDDTKGVAGKIAECVESSDLCKTMFPTELTNVITRFENGYSVEFPVQKEKLRFNRPAKYKFRVDRELLTVLTDSQMKVSEELLLNVVQLVNSDPVMKTYDFLKKRNIFCWGMILLVPMSILFGVLVSLITIVSTGSSNRPDPYAMGFGFVVMMTFGSILEIYPVLIIAMVLAIPKFYHQEKRDIKLQMKICSQFLKRCIDNDVIIVFSGRRNRQPSLHVVRYNFGKCRDYLEYFIQEHRHFFPVDINITSKEYANTLIENHATEISKIMALNYDDLPNASQNRHTLRKGKECLCQRIEKHLKTTLRRTM